MPVSSVKYMARNPDESESGPFDVEELQRRIGDGTFSHDCEVRNALMPRWKMAGQVPELAAAIAAATARATAAEQVAGKKKKAVVVSAGPSGVALHLPGADVYTPGSVSLRLAAGLTDALILGLVGVIVALLVRAAGGGFGSGSALLGTVLWFGAAVLWLAWSVGFSAQTPGQHFWGLLVVKTDGKPVFLDRAFLFALTTLFLGVAMPVLVFLSPSHRGLNDMLSGTRVIRTRIVYDH